MSFGQHGEPALATAEYETWREVEDYLNAEDEFYDRLAVGADVSGFFDILGPDMFSACVGDEYGEMCCE